MRIKRFAARNLTAAMAQIKAEFGLEAVILATREIKDDQGAAVEVTAGLKEEAGPAAVDAGRRQAKAPSAAAALAYLKNAETAPAREAAAEERPEARPSHLDKTLGGLSAGLSEIRELILDLAHRQSLAEKWRQRPDLIKLYRQMVDTGLTQENARFLVETAAENEAAWGGTAKSNIIQYLKSAVKTVDLNHFKGRALALAGPSGVGKSTSLVKLAAWFGQRGRKVGLISLDTLRLGAAYQLKRYARIMGLGFKACQTQNEFRQALDIFEPLDLVLIDTAGRSFSQAAGRADLGAYLALAKAQTLLTVAANLKDADLRKALARSVSRPLAGLIITKLDETDGYGNLINLLLAPSPPLAFFSAGPKVPEDWAPASPEKLGQLWLPMLPGELDNFNH